MPDPSARGGDAPPWPTVRAVSVVIPVKDDLRALARCLRALAAQSAPADEIVVVDDRSCDGGAEVARAAGAVVVASRGPGIPAASATGYDTARGDLLVRLDADSLPPPGWLAGIRRHFARHPETDAVTVGAVFVDGPALLRRPLAALYLGAYQLLLAPALGHPALFGSGMALRRSAWQAVRGDVHVVDADVHDDLDLAFHLGLAHRVRLVRSLRVGISMRPFADVRAMTRRLRRGLHTVAVHGVLGVGPPRWIRRTLRLRQRTRSGRGRAARIR